MPVLAKGEPLSTRILSGNPCSRKVASNKARTCAVSGCFNPWQRNKNRLKASVIVSGSQRAPSWQRNHPLKSAHQTVLGPLACANGWLLGVARDRFFRGTVKPCRRRISPMVLAAGHSISGACRSNQARSFTGPQCVTVHAPVFAVFQVCRSILLDKSRRIV